MRTRSRAKSLNFHSDHVPYESTLSKPTRKRKASKKEPLVDESYKKHTHELDNMVNDLELLSRSPVLSNKAPGNKENQTNLVVDKINKVSGIKNQVTEKPNETGNDDINLIPGDSLKKQVMGSVSLLDFEHFVEQENKNIILSSKNENPESGHPKSRESCSFFVDFDNVDQKESSSPLVDETNKRRTYELENSINDVELLKRSSVCNPLDKKLKTCLMVDDDSKKRRTSELDLLHTYDGKPKRKKSCSFYVNIDNADKMVKKKYSSNEDHTYAVEKLVENNVNILNDYDTNPVDKKFETCEMAGISTKEGKRRRTYELVEAANEIDLLKTNDDEPQQKRIGSFFVDFNNADEKMNTKESSSSLEDKSNKRFTYELENSVNDVELLKTSSINNSSQLEKNLESSLMIDKDRKNSKRGESKELDETVNEIDLLHSNEVDKSNKLNYELEKLVNELGLLQRKDSKKRRKDELDETVNEIDLLHSNEVDKSNKLNYELEKLVNELGLLQRKDSKKRRKDEVDETVNKIDLLPTKRRKRWDLDTVKYLQNQRSSTSLFNNSKDDISKGAIKEQPSNQRSKVERIRIPAKNKRTVNMNKKLLTTTDVKATGRGSKLSNFDSPKIGTEMSGKISYTVDTTVNNIDKPISNSIMDTNQNLSYTTTTSSIESEPNLNTTFEVSASDSYLQQPELLADTKPLIEDNKLLNSTLKKKNKGCKKSEVTFKLNENQRSTPNIINSNTLDITVDNIDKPISNSIMDTNQNLPYTTTTSSIESEPNLNTTFEVSASDSYLQQPELLDDPKSLIKVDKLCNSTLKEYNKRCKKSRVTFKLNESPRNTPNIINSDTLDTTVDNIDNPISNSIMDTNENLPYTTTTSSIESEPNLNTTFEVSASDSYLQQPELLHDTKPLIEDNKLLNSTLKMNNKGCKKSEVACKLTKNQRSTQKVIKSGQSKDSLDQENNKERLVLKSSKPLCSRSILKSPKHNRYNIQPKGCIGCSVIHKVRKIAAEENSATIAEATLDNLNPAANSLTETKGPIGEFWEDPLKIGTELANSGYTEFAFKIKKGPTVTKKEQGKVAMASKTKVPKDILSEKRYDIKGVRSNRRFDLIMKMRLGHK